MQSYYAYNLLYTKKLLEKRTSVKFSVSRSSSKPTHDKSKFTKRFTIILQLTRGVHWNVCVLMVVVQSSEKNGGDWGYGVTALKTHQFWPICKLQIWLISWILIFSPFSLISFFFSFFFSGCLFLGAHTPSAHIPAMDWNMFLPLVYNENNHNDNTNNIEVLEYAIIIDFPVNWGCK